MASPGPLRVKERKATKRQFVSRLDAQAKGGLSWRCFQRRLKPTWPASALLHSCPGTLLAATLSKSQTFLANVHWPGAMAENLMIYLGSLSFEQVSMYFLILPALGAKSQGETCNQVSLEWMRK